MQIDRSFRGMIDRNTENRVKRKKKDERDKSWGLRVRMKSFLELIQLQADHHEWLVLIQLSDSSWNRAFVS